MQAKTFITGLRALSAVLPYAKKIHDDEAQFIWLSLDQRIKDEVTDEMWAYAVGRRLHGRKPPKKWPFTCPPCVTSTDAKTGGQTWLGASSRN